MNWLLLLLITIIIPFSQLFFYSYFSYLSIWIMEVNSSHTSYSKSIENTKQRKNKNLNKTINLCRIEQLQNKIFFKLDLFKLTTSQGENLFTG